jgi:hypothetical protein
MRVLQVPPEHSPPGPGSGCFGGGRGRDAGYPAPPAQTRAGATRAHGSYLGCLAANRAGGQGFRISTGGSTAPSRSRKRSRVHCTASRRLAAGRYSSSPSPSVPSPTDHGRPPGLSVLARGVFMHAWGLRLRRAALLSRWRAPRCGLPCSMTPSAPRLGDFGAHTFGMPSLHMPLSNASTAASRPPSHGSGSGWFATPFLYDSFIHDFTSVYPDAIHALACLFFTASWGAVAGSSAYNLYNHGGVHEL